MNHAEIVGIDILWYDQLVTLPEMPAENGSAFVEGSSFQGGGKVCSALAAAGRQGIPCKLLAVCGDSRRSRFLVEDLQRHGVDTAPSARSPAMRRAGPSFCPTPPPADGGSCGITTPGSRD